MKSKWEPKSINIEEKRGLANSCENDHQKARKSKPSDNQKLSYRLIELTFLTTMKMTSEMEAKMEPKSIKIASEGLLNIDQKHDTKKY